MQSQLNIVKKALKTIKLKKNDLSRLKYELVRKLIKLMVDDFIKNTLFKLNIDKSWFYYRYIINCFNLSFNNCFIIENDNSLD